MNRKIIPIIVAGVFVAIMVFKGDHNRTDRGGIKIEVNTDDEDGSDRLSRKERKVRREKKRNDSSHYALDVGRVDWPPLTQDGAAVTVKPEALSTANYYIVLDGSGSMLHPGCSDGKSKIQAAIGAVKQFVSTIPAQANVGLAAFDRRSISERVPLGIDNRDALRASLDKIVAGSDTPLLTSMKIGYNKLTDQARVQLGYGEYHLIVVTDGQPDPLSEDPRPVVKEILEKSPIVLHTIGFCIDSDHVLNQPNKTFYASATNPQELEKGLQAVLAESPAFDATAFN